MPEKSPRKSLRKIDLNRQFQKALKLLEETEKSVFITGKAGTGKSTFLEYFRAHTKKSTVVLAPTGVAAVNISGETIHSFFRFKPNVTPEEVKTIAQKMRNPKIYREVKTIVIDEVSMVRADLLDCVDILLKAVNKNKKPFGGKQMIFIGDLYQLPPVITKNEKELFSLHYSTPYFFSAKVMERIGFEFVEFEKLYRQKDEKFIDLLNAIRNRTIDGEQLETLNQNIASPEKFKDESFIYLTSTNDLADKINQENLRKLPGKARVFKGEIVGEFDEKSLPTNLNLELKNGARIMLLNNDPFGRWINGTVGTVVKIGHEHLLVELNDGEVEEVLPFTWEMIESYFDSYEKTIKKRTLGSFTQLPVKLAWAITIHKSQGKTFDRVVLDLTKGIFAHGQLYVALSRCRTLEGIVLTKPIKKGHILLDYRIVKFLTEFQYRLAEKELSLEDKKKLIAEAIEKEQRLKIVYLKGSNEKSTREIIPRKMGEMTYLGKKFLGLEAFCLSRNEDRVFRVDRILEIKTA